MDVRDRVETAIGAAEYALLTRGMARLIGFEGGAVEVEGVRVPFFARGWGVPLLFVHGFGGDKESWLLLAAAMRRKRSILIVDLPGFGAAGEIPPERASAQAQARVLARFLDALGYSRAHFVGNSMGGGISLRFAHDYAERVASMTLIGSVGPVVEKSEVLLALDRGENPLVLDSLEDIDRLLSLVAEKKPISTKAMRRYLAGDRFARRDALTQLFRGWNDPNVGEGLTHIELETLTTPALVIHGARDRVIHHATGRALAARLPNARLEVLSDIGHVPQMEDPRTVARLVEAFVDGVDEARLANGHA